MPVTRQPKAVESQPTLLNSPFETYEKALKVKESECADACVSSSQSDRKRNRSSDTGFTECTLTNSRKSVEISIICSVFKCCGLNSGIACLLAGVAVLPCVRHNTPNCNGHARSEDEIDQLNRTLKHIKNEGCKFRSDKVVESALAYEISTSIVEYERKIARGKSSHKDVQRWLDKSRVLIRIYHFLRMKDLPNTWKVGIDECKAENPQWNAGDLSTKTANFVGMAVAELSARALAKGLGTLETCRPRGISSEQGSGAGQDKSSFPVAQPVDYNPPMAGEIMVQESPQPPYESLAPSPAAPAPSFFSRLFGGSSESSATPSAPPVSTYGQGYAVELQTDNLKLEV